MVHQWVVAVEEQQGRIGLMKIALLFLTVALSGLARATSAPSETAMTTHCIALAHADLAGVQDAPTQVTSATAEETTSNGPAFCKVQGYVAPQIGFELRLPLANWNGKFIEIGCGGSCGHLGWTFWCPLQKGYAC